MDTLHCPATGSPRSPKSTTQPVHCQYPPQAISTQNLSYSPIPAFSTTAPSLVPPCQQKGMSLEG